jgi:hypothetical protein
MRAERAQLSYWLSHCSALLAEWNGVLCFSLICFGCFAMFAMTARLLRFARNDGGYVVVKH